jgi:uncharacterized lipoprotein YmbA
MKPIVLVLLGLSLAGCAGEPSVYYTLTAPAQSLKPQVVSTSGAAYTIAPVTVPAQVDDSLLVVRRGEDGIMKLAHDRWSAPLGKQIGNSLAVQMTHLLGAAPLSRAQTASVAGKFTTVTVDVQRFDLVPGQFALLAATWQVSPPQAAQTPRALICYTELREPVAPGVAPLVQAQQLNIERLAQAISLAWQTGQPGADTRCQ